MPTRRQTLVLGLAAAAAAGLPAGRASARTYQDILDDFAAGVVPEAGGITIDAPEIAENGQSVPVTITAPGATEIVFVNTKNPTPGLARVRFMEAAGTAMIATRVRLGETQEVIAMARYPDGRITMARAEVKVTIGGCGG